MKCFRKARNVLLAFFFMATCAMPAMASTDPEALLAQLRSLPGVSSAVQASSAIPGTLFYRVTFTQPVDHRLPSGPTFQQRVTLLHRDEAAPVVLVTNGYATSLAASQAELTHYLAANQIRVEHRFFAGSDPFPRDWSKLDIAQSAADLHAIRQAFKLLYAGGWVATGASKSGMTSTYYSYHYPGDVDAVVPYVAPSSHGTSDQRYVTFLTQVGPADCRAKLKDFQVAALQQRDAILPLVPDGDHAVLGKDRALEFAVLELPFAFWQYLDQTTCSQIPPGSATPAELLDFINAVVGMDMLGDATLAYYAPYFYQSATQLGGPGYDESGLEALLRYPGQDIPENYPPLGVAKPFDPSMMAKVERWVQLKGRHFIFIYGENDPWSTNAFQVTHRNDSYRYYVRGDAGNHGAGLADLTMQERDFILGKLRAWLRMPAPALAASRKAALAPPRAETLMREDRYLR